MLGVIKILDPRQEAIIDDKGISPGLDLTGKTIGYRHYLSWSNFDVFLQRIEELMRQKYKTSGPVRVNITTAGKYLAPGAADEFAATIDAAILGLGN
ncbi:MAG: hypothetical protein HYX92_15190 [Chloroflexi bacterium]|nr:hypothetical protein [Chloroflexota bacterium]